MLRISAIYPNDPGSHFDRVYYAASHAPFADKLLRPHGLRKIRTTLGLAALDGLPPPYWAISEMIFTDRAAFDAAMDVCGNALFADLVNYTSSTPVLQVSRLDGEAD